jgi:hypothetical protein
MTIRSEEYSMFKSATFPIAIALFTCVAGPALARSDEAQQLRLTKEVAGGKTVYCHDGRTTGSHVNQKTCLTKEEWAQRGTVLESGRSEANKDSKTEGTIKG